MLSLVFRQARWRLLVGALLAGALPLWLPSASSPRTWALVAFAMVAPWLVLGREAARRSSGWRSAQALAPKGRRLVALEFLPSILVVGLFAMVGSQGAWRFGLALAAWAFALVAVADALDRTLVRPGAAWTVGLLGTLGWLLAPSYLGAFFGRTALAPWLSTYTIGLSPVAAGLTAQGHSALQDPLFYTYTLAGALEVRPLGWFWGTSLFVVVALVAVALSGRAARRSPRSL